MNIQTYQHVCENGEATVCVSAALLLFLLNSDLMINMREMTFQSKHESCSPGTPSYSYTSLILN